MVIRFGLVIQRSPMKYEVHLSTIKLRGVAPATNLLSLQVRLHLTDSSRDIHRSHHHPIRRIIHPSSHHIPPHPRHHTPPCPNTIHHHMHPHLHRTVQLRSKVTHRLAEFPMLLLRPPPS